ncbi:hypothetical protein MRB53_003897 [Persea americana]|uniref:Uncharacterized protein n=1 Tax=Persea americana TaxID=3435 RepID=A0ACC2MYZ4_PERAE|nr:hypothetical protein MRB53_003897 [Persea americana]
MMRLTCDQEFQLFWEKQRLANVFSAACASRHWKVAGVFTACRRSARCRGRSCASLVWFCFRNQNSRKQTGEERLPVFLVTCVLLLRVDDGDQREIEEEAAA